MIKRYIFIWYLLKYKVLFKFVSGNLKKIERKSAVIFYERLYFEF